MTRGRLALAALVTLIVVLGLGYAWGVSGRSAIENALQASRQQLDMAEARGAILDARVSLYNNNFGDASRRLEDAKAPLRRLRQQLQEAGENGPAASIETAVRHVDEAQQLAARLDPTANARAGEALEAIKVASSR
jgi:hypothetical protein